MTQQTVFETSKAAEGSTHRLIPAGRVEGTDIYNRAGDKLGSVKDVAIDKASGRVAYAILSFGGFLGIGERYVPVPWSVLKYDTDRNGYVIPVSKDELEKAPNFEARQLSGWDDSEDRSTIHTYYAAYGVVPYWG